MLSINSRPAEKDTMKDVEMVKAIHALDSTDEYNVREDLLLTDESTDELPLNNQTVVNESPCKPDGTSLKLCDKTGLVELSQHTPEPSDHEVDEADINQIEKNQVTKSLTNQTKSEVEKCLMAWRLRTKHHSLEKLQNAMRAVQDQGVSVTFAAKIYKIPPISVFQKIIIEEVSSIRESNRIIHWVKKIARAGFTVSKDQIVTSVSRLIKDLYQNNQIGGWSVEDVVLREFFQQQSYLAKKMAEAETSSKSELSEGHLRKWFMDVNDYIKEKRLTSVFKDERSIFNIDEITFFPCPKKNSMITGNDKEINNSLSRQVERDSLVVFMAANAAGQLVPPLVPSTIIDQDPIDWFIGKSDSGSEYIFFEYIKNIFHPWLISQNIPLPVILFISDHSPYVTYHLSQFCAANSIKLVAYPNSTYVHQPMDIGVFNPLKSFWESAVIVCQSNSQDQTKGKEDFSFLLNKVLEDNLRNETIMEGFKKTGLIDLDPDKINFSSLLIKGTTSHKPSSCTSIRNKRCSGLVKDSSNDSSISLKEVGLLDKEISPGPTDGDNLRDDVPLTDGVKSRNELPLENQNVVKRRENIRNAIHAVHDQDLNLKNLVKRYDIPSATLYGKIIRQVSKIKKSNLIDNWVKKIAIAGFPVSKDQIVSSVLRLIKYFNQNNPNGGWSAKNLICREFFQHQSYLAKRVAESETSFRAEVSEDHLRQWLIGLNDYIKKKSLTSVFKDERRIYNADEIAIFICPKKNIVMTRKEEQIQNAQSWKEESVNVKVLLASNAAGQLVPPMVPNTVSSDHPKNSDSGWATGETFFEYIKNIFHPWLTRQNIPLPVILFINSHSSYVTYHLSEFCSANKIELVPYPNAAFVLQPMDIGVFNPLKIFLESAVKIWQMNNQEQVQTNEQLTFLLNKVLEENLKSETIIESFKKTGLVDLDPDKINLTSLLRKETSNKQSICTSIIKKRSSDHLKHMDSSIGLKEVGILQGLPTGSIDEYNVDDLPITDENRSRDVLPLENQNVGKKIENLENAIHAVRVQGLNLNHVAKRYDIPSATLYDNIMRQEISSIRKSNLINDWVKKTARAGFPISKDQIVSSVLRLIKDLNQNNQIRGWSSKKLVCQKFFQYQPYLAERVAEAETSYRAEVSEDQLRQWFMDVNDYIKEKCLTSLFKDERRIFNADEIAFFLCPEKNIVMARKDEHMKSWQKENVYVKVLLSSNAAGQLVQPMVPTTVKIDNPQNSVWATGDLFFDYITNIFHPWLTRQNIPLPVILFINSHSPYVTYHLSEFCSANSIELVPYPNAAFVLQPMDIGVFNPLKSFLESAVKNWQMNNQGQVQTNEGFSVLLNKVLQENIKSETIIEGFKKTGLVDLSPEKINFSNLLRRGTLCDKPSSYINNRKRRFNGSLKDIDSSIDEKEVGLLQHQEILTGPTDEYNVGDDILLTDGIESEDELPLVTRLNQIVVNKKPCIKQVYSLKNVEKAIHDVLYQGLNYKHVAKSFNIPSATLYDKIIRREISSIEESNLIVDWVRKMVRAGFTVCKDQIVTSVLSLIKDLNQNSLTGGSYAKNLVRQKFFQHQPYLAERVAEAEKSSRAEVSAGQLRQWFMDVNDYIKEKCLISIFDDGRRIFNVDEIAFFFGRKKNTVMAKKDKKKNSLTKKIERDSLIALMAANAAGQLVPPWAPTTCNIQHAIHFTIGKLDAGSVSEDMFFEYIKTIFHPWLINQNIPLPVILFINGHSPHVTYRLSQFCSANSIELVPYPNATFVLQPMDIGVCNPLKSVWKSAVKICLRNNRSQIKRKEEFSFLLNKILEKNLKNETIIEGFKKTGLVDLNPDKINLSSLLRKGTLFNKPFRKRRSNGLLKDIDSTIGLEEEGLLQQGISTGATDGDYVRDDFLLTNGCEGDNGIPLEIETLNNETTCNPDCPSLNHCDKPITMVGQVGFRQGAPKSSNKEVDKVSVNLIENNQLTKSSAQQPNSRTSFLSKRCLFLPGPWNQESTKQSRSEKVPEVMTASFYKLYLEKKRKMEENEPEVLVVHNAKDKSTS